MSDLLLHHSWGKIMDNRKFVPFGENIKMLLSQSKINKTDINHILRSRGVFCSSSEKTDTVPVLVKTIISPNEYNDFISNITVKETSSKFNLRSLHWESDTSLIDALHESIDKDSIITNNFLNYEISDYSDFYCLDSDPDHVTLDFEIKRTDLLDNWTEQEKFFKGKIELQKPKDPGEEVSISITLTHTSPETKIVGDLILQKMETSLKQNKHIREDSNIVKIRFNDFSNENRILFLRNVASKHLNSEFYFKEIVDFQFKPDENSIFDDDVKWLEKNIDELIIKGNLENTLFLSKKEIHASIQAFRLVASYEITLLDYKGSCRVSFEFPDFIAKDNKSAELVIDFKSFSMKGMSNKKQFETKQSIMKEIELEKNKQYVETKICDA